MLEMRRTRIGDDSGVALITVLGVMLVITVLAIGAYTLSSQVLHESVRLENESEAFRAASSGLERVLSSFSVDEATAMIAAGPIVDHTPDGTYTVTAEDLGGNEWRLTSVGVDSNGVRETVKQEFYFLDLWKMNFSGGSASSSPGAGGALNGQSSIVGPFYARGDMSMNMNMALLEGPLFLKDGNLFVPNGGPNYWVGMAGSPLKVYADGGANPPVPPNEVGSGGKGVYIDGPYTSVPDIELPPITDEDLKEWATTAKNESVDNVMGNTGKINLEAVVDGETRDPATYTTLQPPNTTTWSRERPQAGSGPYKLIAGSGFSLDGVGVGSGTLASPFVIGGRTFGAWGSVVTTDGVSLSAGPTGIASYTTGVTDDFAYNDAANILYLWGTVYVDGDLVIAEDMEYIGNGTIIANGDITLVGELRPYQNNGNNTQGENNKWAVGLVTPGDIEFQKAGGTNTGNIPREQLRDVLPGYAGAFYCGGEAFFPDTNTMVRGSILAGQMKFSHPNNVLVTNPLLPTYLPESLPGLGVGILTPGLWSRGG